jgi:hypothetical protein
VLLAALVERRWPEWPGVQPFFANWSATIGELKPVSLTNRSWLHWSGGLILLSPFLLAVARRRRILPLAFAGLLFLSFSLTLWQARWGYFFVVVFILTIPAQIAVVRPNWLAWSTVGIALWPLLQFWDGRIWPNEATAAWRAQARIEAAEWRNAATALAGAPTAPVLAPWWLSPAVTYWSGQPAVAGSSHESLPGIVESARFFLATSPNEAREILRRHGVQWVLSYDGDRTAENSAALLGVPAPASSLCRTLDRFPSQAPPFHVLAGQNGSCKVYRVRN